MLWLLGGYMWLFIHRPFEVWPALGAYQVERAYMLLTILCWLCYLGKQWVPNRLHIAFIGFTLALVFCWLASPYVDKGTKTVEDYFKVAVFYVLVISTVRDEQSLRKLVFIYLMAVSLYMTHSLGEFVHGRHVYRMGIRRMIGVDFTYKDPNTFSATLLYSLPLMFPLWAHATTRWLRGLLVYYAGLSVVCILLTGSRGSLVGLGCLGLLWLWRSQRRGLAVFLLVLLIPVGWSLLPGELQNRFHTLIDPSVGPASAQKSAAGRTQGLIQGLMLWAKSPVTGFGPNSFGSAVGHGFQAHNLYGQTLGELGGLGLLALAGIVCAFARNAAEVRRLSREQITFPGDFPRELSRAVSLAVILLLVLGMGSHNLYRYTWMWFGAFQAIALHCLRSRKYLHLQEAGSEGPDHTDSGRTSP
jgi:O-antigen ligase